MLSGNILWSIKSPHPDLERGPGLRIDFSLVDSQVGHDLGFPLDFVTLHTGLRNDYLTHRFPYLINGRTLADPAPLRVIELAANDVVEAATRNAPSGFLFL